MTVLVIAGCGTIVSLALVAVGLAIERFVEPPSDRIEP